MIIGTNFINPEKNEEGYKVSLWNKTYQTGNNGALFSSIIAADKEILARPATLNVFNNGEKCEFGMAKTYLIADDKEDEKTIVSAFESRVVTVNVCHRIEEDGVNDMTITVMPRGRSVAQFFGFEELHTDEFSVDKIYVEFPLSKNAVRSYHTYPFGGRIGNTQPIENTILNFAGKIPEGGFHCGFKAQVYLGGDNCGLGLFFESNEGWVNADENRVVEILEDDDCYIMRINLVDMLPEIWADKGPDDQYAMDLPPMIFKVGMAVTPLRPFPKRRFYHRYAKIDSYKKIFCEYDEFLSGKKEADGSVVESEIKETRYDRLKRLGVETLLIHEKWNDMQNSPIITVETKEKTKKIIDELHKRGVKCIPYFGYEISTLSPIWAKYGDKFIRGRQKYSHDYWYWYRQPYQRAMNVCMNNEWADILYDGITKMYDELGFDGLYFDCTLEPRPCNNEKHGCGWRDKDGKLHETYQQWAIRKFLKKIYAFVQSRGGTLMLHSSNSFTLAGLSFCDFLGDGEVYQKELLHGKLKEMPEDLIRAEFLGYDTGVPVKTIIYINEPVWTYKNALTTAILHGSVPHPNDIEKPLDLIVPLWNALDNFPLEDAQWKPYFNATHSITCDDAKIKISAWETEDKILAVIASVSADYKGKINITSDKFKKFTDALELNPLSENGTFSTELTGFDFAMVVGEK